MAETLLSLIPLAVLIAVGVLIARWIRSQPPAPLDPAALLIPTYSGPFALFRRHYNGDYSLARSYWVHLLLLQVLAGGVMLAVVPWFGRSFQARYASAAFLLLCAAVFSLWVWAAAGTWAAASKHVSRGGRHTWASLAKIAIVLGALRILGDTAGAMPAFREHWEVALGHQIGRETALQVRADGKSILLSGGINDGSADLLAAAIKLAPSVTTVVFASEGGWIREGQLLADVIRKNRLNTYIEQYCASACTIAFLAGADRAAAPGAKIGFHSARSVGSNRSREDSADLKQQYEKAGLPAAFVRRALETPHGEMWFPSHDTLRTAGVLTRASLGGETAAIATSVRGRSDLEAGLRKEELFALFEQRDPGGYKAMMDAAWNSLGNGATDAEFTVAVRDQLLPAIMAYVPVATDSTLVDYHALMIEQLKTVAAVDAGACVELAFPSGQPMKILAALPANLRTREVALMTQALREADEVRRIRPTDAQVNQVARIALARMTQRQMLLFGDEEARRRSTPAETCTAATAFFTGLGDIPEGQRGRALRVLYSAK